MTWACALIGSLKHSLSMATEVEELVGFLSSPSPQVKKAAVDIVQGLTGSEEGVQSLANHSNTLLPSLLHLVGDKKVGDEKLQGLYLAKLVRLFSISSTENEGKEDPYGHIGSVIVNISRMEIGRKLLLDPKRSLLKIIIRQIDSPSLLRRKGVSGAIRNCCFDAETQLSNLLLTSQFLWPALLLPLAGKQAYSKEDTDKMPLELANPLSHERDPEKDPEIRVQAAESLYLIAMQEGGRRGLWSINGPRILEVGYQDEGDPQVMEGYERLGSLLIHGSGLEEDIK